VSVFEIFHKSLSVLLAEAKRFESWEETIRWIVRSLANAALFTDRLSQSSLLPPRSTHSLLSTHFSLFPYLFSQQVKPPKRSTSIVPIFVPSSCWTRDLKNSEVLVLEVQVDADEVEEVEVEGDVVDLEEEGIEVVEVEEVVEGERREVEMIIVGMGFRKLELRR